MSALGHLETIWLPSGTAALPQQADISAAHSMVPSVPGRDIERPFRAHRQTV
jgi:hypothetical protein